MLGDLKRKFRQFLASQLDRANERQRIELQDEIRYRNGTVLAAMNRGKRFPQIHDAAFQVFSQFGEDGIIQHLIERVPIENDLFIEFGVEDYRESNTRFLLQYSNGRGVIADAEPGARTFLDAKGLYGWHEISFVQSFITVENINELFRPWAGDIGLISIDVDGVDYYLWEALEVVSPRIVVIEYQSTFGPDLPISVPYRPDFVRREHHWSMMCAGASLSALTHLARRKGYALVGTSGVHNAFFVRRDVLGDLPEIAPEEAYVAVRYRESRDREGRSTYLTSMEERRREMRDAEVVNVVTGERMTVGQAFGLS